MLLYHFSRREKQTTFVGIGTLRIKIEGDKVCKMADWIAKSVYYKQAQMGTYCLIRLSFLDNKGKDDFFMKGKMEARDMIFYFYTTWNV